MKTIFALTIAVFATASVQAITIDTVPVGNVGNANDPATGNLYGGVGYAYSIGKYEVTVGQYTAFLNAVAASDMYGLYNTRMQTDHNSAGVARVGVSGSYSYSVIGSPNHPITFVSSFDAERFANWLNNGQPSGAQDGTTTEDGAYTLNGTLNVPRHSNAKWFISSESEWYKAAFYQPAALGGDADNYWNFPMRTNSVPYSDQPPGATPDNTRVGNIYSNDNTANGFNDGYAATGSTNYSSSQNYLTDVGAYASSPSFYGTFDQGGNVWEWTEAIDGARVVRGGAWLDGSGIRAAGRKSYSVGQDEYAEVGFRVTTVTGDYNGDGIVDGADYALWRKAGGAQANYDVWRTHFGQPTGSGAAFSSKVAAPEPAASVLLVIIGCASIITRRRKSVPHDRV